MLVLWNQPEEDVYEKWKQDGPQPLAWNPSQLASEVGTVEEEMAAFLAAIRRNGYDVFCVNLKDEIEKVTASITLYEPDVIFNLVEYFYDDETMEPHFPALYELYDLPYTGNPALTLQLCQNKVRTKVLLEDAGLPTSPYFVVEKEPIPNPLDLELHYPLIVKPAREDASGGIEPESVVTSYQALVERCRYLFKEFEQPALVEEYIEGREIHAAVLGNKPAEVLPLFEMEFDDSEFYPDEHDEHEHDEAEHDEAEHDDDEHDDDDEEREVDEAGHGGEPEEDEGAEAEAGEPADEPGPAPGQTALPVDPPARHRPATEGQERALDEAVEAAAVAEAEALGQPAGGAPAADPGSLPGASAPSPDRARPESADEFEGFRPQIISYKAKWDPNSKAFYSMDAVCPAENLDPELEAHIKAIALRAYKVMGCRDYARIDMRVDEEGHAYILEVNPNPDLADGSAYVMCSDASGRTYAQVIGEVIKMALARRPKEDANAKHTPVSDHLLREYGGVKTPPGSAAPGAGATAQPSGGAPAPDGGPPAPGGTPAPGAPPAEPAAPPVKPDNSAPEHNAGSPDRDRNRDRNGDRNGSNGT